MSSKSKYHLSAIGILNGAKEEIFSNRLLKLAIDKWFSGGIKKRITFINLLSHIDSKNVWILLLLIFFHFVDDYQSLFWVYVFCLWNASLNCIDKRTTFDNSMKTVHICVLFHVISVRREPYKCRFFLMFFFVFFHFQSFVHSFDLFILFKQILVGYQFQTISDFKTQPFHVLCHYLCVFYAEARFFFPLSHKHTFIFVYILNSAGVVFSSCFSPYRIWILNWNGLIKMWCIKRE